MRWAIITNGVDTPAVIHGPEHWHAAALSQKLRAQGFNVSLPAAEPATALDWPGVTICPVTEISVSVAVTQTVIGETVAIADGTVTATPTVRDKTATELNPPQTEEETDRDDLQREYLTATRDLAMIATGKAHKLGDKLTSREFKAMSQQAALKDLTATVLLLATLQYTLFALQARGVTWDRIALPPERPA